MGMEKASRTLTPAQQEVLSNPNVLATFLYLLDGASSNDEIARRTGFRPLETSVYLDRMREVGLVRHARLATVGGKSVQAIYEVAEPDVDLSEVVPAMSPGVALDLVYNKVREDVTQLNLEGKLLHNSGIKYAQIRVPREAFEEFLRRMNAIEDFIRENEVTDGDANLTFLLIGYRTDAGDFTGQGE